MVPGASPTSDFSDLSEGYGASIGNSWRMHEAGAATSLPLGWAWLFVRSRRRKTMAREELKWQNIDADDLPAEVKKSFDAMVEAEAVFKADLEKLLKVICRRTSSWL
jgi:hypothetical protein